MNTSSGALRHLPGLLPVLRLKTSTLARFPGAPNPLKGKAIYLALRIP